ncbi:MAG: alcohol dehydrogenase catalytic domain-containing protein [Caldilineaceae bacterium]
MKVAVQTGIRTFALQERPNPVAPPGGLVLRVDACGVCGSDLRRWREGLPAGVAGLVPGHEVAGTVLSVGPGLEGFAAGDRLALAPDVHCGHCWYCRRELFNLCDHQHYLGISPGYDGGFAEQMVLTHEVMERGIVHPYAPALAPEIAALAEPCSSVLAAHEEAGTSLNDTVVVIGAGPIGCLLVAVAHARGARTVMIVRSSSRRALVERFAPDLVVDAGAIEPVAAVREYTEGLGADVVMCANPDASTQEQAVRMVRKGGKVILFGGLPKAAPMTTLDGNLIHYGEIVVMGAFSYHPTAHALALDLYRRGALPVDRLITHRFPLAQIDDAFAMAAGGAALKVMVLPNG